MQPRFAAAMTPRLACDRISGNGMLQAIARRWAMCSAEPLNRQVQVAWNELLTNEDGACFGIVRDYEVDNVSRNVPRIGLSYTDFVNRVVWRKRV